MFDSVIGTLQTRRARFAVAFGSVCAVLAAANLERPTPSQAAFAKELAERLEAVAGDEPLRALAVLQIVNIHLAGCVASGLCPKAPGELVARAAEILDGIGDGLEGVLDDDDDVEARTCDGCSASE